MANQNGGWTLSIKASLPGNTLENALKLKQHWESVERQLMDAGFTVELFAKPYGTKRAEKAAPVAP